MKAVYFDAMNKKYLPLRVLVIGHGGHGKDEFATRFSNITGVRFSSSSEFACEHVVFPWFKENIEGLYDTADECFLDRRSWRDVWHRIISDYNKDDPSKLARQIMNKNEMYVGMRSRGELEKCMNDGLFTHVFWVDAEGRIESEPVSSMNIVYDPDTMCMIDNSGDLRQLQEEVELAARMLGFPVQQEIMFN